MVLHKQAVKNYYQRYQGHFHESPTAYRMAHVVLFLTCDLLKKPGMSEAARKTAHKGLPKAHIMDVSMAKVQT